MIKTNEMQSKVDELIGFLGSLKLRRNKEYKIDISSEHITLSTIPHIYGMDFDFCKRIIEHFGKDTALRNVFGSDEYETFNEDNDSEHYRIWRWNIETENIKPLDEAGIGKIDI